MHDVQVTLTLALIQPYPYLYLLALTLTRRVSFSRTLAISTALRQSVPAMGCASGQSIRVGARQPTSR